MNFFFNRRGLGKSGLNGPGFDESVADVFFFSSVNHEGCSGYFRPKSAGISPSVGLPFEDFGRELMSVEPRHGARHEFKDFWRCAESVSAGF